MQQDIGKKGVHDVYTKSFHAKTFSRVSTWINHDLTTERAKQLEAAIEEAVLAAVKAWVQS